MKGRVLLVAAAAIVAGVAAGSLPAQTAPQLDGRKLYQARCIGCHGSNMWATKVLSRRVQPAELDKRSDLQPAMVSIVVRRGMGQMPPIRRAELDDASLAAIAAYPKRETPQ